MTPGSFISICVQLKNWVVLRTVPCYYGSSYDMSYGKCHSHIVPRVWSGTQLFRKGSVKVVRMPSVLLVVETHTSSSQGARKGNAQRLATQLPSGAMRRGDASRPYSCHGAAAIGP